MGKAILNNLQVFTNEIISNSVVENHNFILTNVMLVALLLVSLALTFYNQGTTVHKVLGLLLVSIFVVFIWILHTQFLFIYIVYILAFISAVLMLFLSVVLMLPISALSSTNSKRAYSPAVLLFNQYINFLEISPSVITEVVVWTTICSFVIKQLKTKVPVNSNFIFSMFSNDLIQKYQKTRFSSKISNLLIILFLNFECLFTSFYKNTCAVIEGVYTYTIALFKSTLYITAEFLVQKSPTFIFKTVLDTVFQTYLFLNAVLLLVVAFNREKIIYVPQLTDLTLDSTQGINQLKSLLYGDFSAFLILSTVILLIALLGAAVMTRTKRT